MLLAVPTIALLILVAIPCANTGESALPPPIRTGLTLILFSYVAFRIGSDQFGKRLLLVVAAIGFLFAAFRVNEVLSLQTLRPAPEHVIAHIWICASIAAAIGFIAVGFAVFRRQS